MGLRITTWNVNGIRNPFAYQPWKDKKTFAAMFDVLEADIVVMQETKIQRKDLRDDMVLIPGWDVYFSLPRHKHGYSGVAIYTRNAVCAPIRAEDGITGVLCSKDSPIGGYPTAAQLSRSSLGASTLDAEGRCVVLEFPAFVLLGVYCPARRRRVGHDKPSHDEDDEDDEDDGDARKDFRFGFLNALDARVRNLESIGKRVVVAGDLNICRDEIDSAEEQRRRLGQSKTQRLFNQLVLDGRVVGDRDDGPAESILVDLCRSFHPERRGMFTCWSTKINARPGNYGARIDYILCSRNMKDWFVDANIQEGLLGSDHCPVFAVMRDMIDIDSVAVHMKDIMNPHGMFEDGGRRREWTRKDLLPLSAKLMPDFDKRRNIRDMFVKMSSMIEHSAPDEGDGSASQHTPAGSQSTQADSPNKPQQPFTQSHPSVSDPPDTAAESLHTSKDSHWGVRSDVRSISRGKRSADSPLTPRPPKRGPADQGQRRLTGFFKPQVAAPDQKATLESDTIPNSAPRVPAEGQDDRAAETWSLLLSRQSPPRCSHNELCVLYVTKKPGINCGRAFYICARPLGPSGTNENGTPWRCTTFIWKSEWRGKST